MAAFAGDFGDGHEEESGGPLLPPEDRLWRHPSELNIAAGVIGLDPASVRRRWLQTQPSKASAWTAGVVGALLATGLVLLGTHLATAIAGHPADPGALEPATTTNTELAAQAASSRPAASVLGLALVTAIRSTGAAIAVIDSQIGSTEARSLALVVRSDGMLIAPAAAVAHASSVLVTLPNGVVYVGEVIASDPGSGLSLVHINGVNHLRAIALDSASAPTDGQMALAVVAPGGLATSLGAVTNVDTSPAVGGTRIVDAMTTDLPAQPDPVGGALVSANGTVTGMIIGQEHGRAVAVPTWILGPVVQQLIATQSVSSGYLGLSCVTAPGSAFTSGGARVLSVQPGSAAAGAGIHPGDLVVALLGAPITTKAALEGRLHILKPGTRVTLTILRAGSARTVSVRLGGA